MRKFATTIMFLLSFAAWAEDSSEPSFGKIKSIDLSDEKPNRPASPNHITLALRLNKVRPGLLGQVTIYQFSKRARIDFDGNLPKGEYALYAATSCQAASGTWTLLHRFKSTGQNVQTEKSLPNVALNDPKPGLLVIKGKALILKRAAPPLTIDCQIVQQQKQDD